jgi:hypothetical protein
VLVQKRRVDQFDVDPAVRELAISISLRAAFSGSAKGRSAANFINRCPSCCAKLGRNPREHLQFHLWYLKAKGWIARLETGTIAITVEGVDRTNSEYRRETTTKFLTDPNHIG